MPEPIMTMSTFLGGEGVVRWVARWDGGSCQYERVGRRGGSPGVIVARLSIAMDVMVVGVNTDAQGMSEAIYIGRTEGRTWPDEQNENNLCSQPD